MDELVGGPAAALTAVALVLGPKARANGWAARAAVALAARWDGPRRALLADLDLAAPSLHDAAGVPNEEGVIDLVEYGASLGKVVRPGGVGSFDVIPAGLFTPDPGSILRHDGWTRVLLEVAARRATLLACVPADADGLDAVIDRSGAVVVLADADEADAVVRSLPRPCAVLAVLSPADDAFDTPSPSPSPHPSPSPAPSPSRLTDEDFERIRLPKDRSSREALIREIRDRQRAERQVQSHDPLPHAPARHPHAPAQSIVESATAATTAAAAAAAAATAPPAASAPLPERGPLQPEPAPLQPEPQNRRLAAWATAIVLFAALAGAAWYFFGWRPLPAGSRAEVTASASAPAPETRVAEEIGAPGSLQFALPYVVAVAAYRELSMALERERDLSEIEPQLRFHVEPLERDGVLYYHVMAGPVPDSASALALRDTLIIRGHKTGATPTDIRATPLAFLVGEHASQVDAFQQRDSLRSLDVPGYVLEATSSDGRPRYRLYVGGFSGEAEADVTRAQLRAAGIENSLVTRTGSIIHAVGAVRADSLPNG